MPNPRYALEDIGVTWWLDEIEHERETPEEAYRYLHQLTPLQTFMIDFTVTKKPKKKLQMSFDFIKENE